MAELTVVAARNARPLDKAYRLAAGKGLYLQVMPNGAKYWRQKYRFAGIQKLLAHGVFPEVSLADARAARDAARQLLASGVDPGTQRRIDRLSRDAHASNSLETLARLWHAEKSNEWVDTYTVKVLRRLEMHVFPWLGMLPIKDVTAPMILATMRRIHDSGTTETAHRTRNYLSQIFRWAIVRGKADRDPAADLVGAIPASAGRSFPTITEPSRIGELLRAVDVYRGSYVTRFALKMAPLVFTRPGELRLAEWVEFDLDKAEWSVPAMRLKMRKAKKATAEAHVVPLSRQVLALLQELRPLSGSGRYVFPGERTASRPMSENTINSAFARMGFKGEIVAHGLRHMASTALNEKGWSADAIERQLAHQDLNRIRGIYNKAQYLEERRQMMQAWADYLDELRAEVPVIARRSVA